MTTSLRTSLFLLVCACAPTLARAQGVAPVASAAQDSDDPFTSARIRLGPLAFTPSGSLTNFGMDSNVFNEVEDPKRDFTFTLSPHLDSWFRAGRSRTTVTAQADFIYFQKYASERSVDGRIAGRFMVLGNRLTPWVSGGYANGRQRVGYEIDLRSRRITRDAAIGADLRFGKERLAFSASHSTFEFDGDAVFLGSNLQRVLDHSVDGVKLEVRHSMSVLTTAVLEAEGLRDRFDFAKERDSDSVRIRAGFDLDPRALIGGGIRIGYRRFTGVSGSTPDYSGVVADFDAGATIFTRTRVELAGQRDLEYSADAAYPYYLLTGAVLTMTPRLTQTWDVQGRVGGQRLAYRTFRSAGIADRLDRRVQVGAGIGYHLGRTTRIGFNVDHERRSSPIQSRDYKGFRIGTSVTYGR